MSIKYFWAKIMKKIRGSAVINSVVPKSSKVESGSQVVNSVFGKHSFCGYECEIINAEIGSFCSIANHVIIGGANHPISWGSTSPVFYFGKDSVKAKFSTHMRPEDEKTIIGNDVWIGERAMLKQGITVGDGSVVGMGSVVTKDIPPYEIWGGNPAHFIKKRFDNEIIKSLEELKWWDLDEKELELKAKYITDINAFVEEIKGKK